MGPLVSSKEVYKIQTKYKDSEPLRTALSGAWWWDRNFIAMTIGLLRIFRSGYHWMTGIDLLWRNGTDTLLALPSVVSLDSLMAVVAVRSSIRRVDICLKVCTNIMSWRL
jgi:hypothetical protein